MKRGPLIRAGLYVVILAGAGYLASSQYKTIWRTPSVASVPEMFDFGIVQQNTKVENNVPLVNRQRHAVTIEKVTTSCGCTVVQPETKTIETGDTISLPIVFSAGGRPGPTASDVHVTMSDGSVQNFTITAYVVAENAGIVNFGNILNTSENEQRVFELLWPRNLPLQVSSVDYDASLLDVVVSSHEARRMTRFAISLKQGIDYGNLRSRIKLEFDSAAFPPTSIVVTGNVLMPLEVSTYSLAAGMLRRDGKQDLSFSVYSPYDLPVTITKMEVLRGRCDELRAHAVNDAEQEVSFALLTPVEPAALVAQSVVRVHAEAGGFTRTFDVEATALIDNGAPET